jgi:2-polyprenyl-6-hydroxyphenyl methylase/3-demethylubiquinone-9 3-methyltransferase
MQKVREEIYKRINNKIYEQEGDKWWNEDFSLSLIKTTINPFRVGYSKKIIEKLKINPDGKTALEVGCGGGILCEEIARIGFRTFGIDPARQSIKAAMEHSDESGLNINYATGTGENLQFQDNTFEVVFCCDVLEHIRDLPKVISEISRVLKPGGIFIYDTFNRTFLSKLVVIKILQEWKRWAIMPFNLHVWEMFIKPREIKSLLKKNNLDWREHRGIKPDVPYLKMLRLLHKRAKGYLTYQEFGNEFRMIESCSIRVIYMGYAVKKITW